MSCNDIQCICTDTTFQTNAAGCVTSNCPDQIQSALSLQQQQCAAVSGGSSSGSSGSGSSDTASATGGSGSSTGSASIPSGTSPTNSVSRSVAPGNSNTATNSGSNTASNSGASAANTNAASTPVTLVSGPGAALAVIVSLAGVVAGDMIHVGDLCFCADHGFEFCNDCHYDHRITNNFMMENELKRIFPGLKDPVDLGSRPPLPSVFGSFSPTKEKNEHGEPIFECKLHKDVNCKAGCLDWVRVIVSHMKRVFKDPAGAAIDIPREDKIRLLASMASSFHQRRDYRQTTSIRHQSLPIHGSGAPRRLFQSRFAKVPNLGLRIYQPENHF
ncbi:hypothetical protein D9758_015387 [Tetrapyrgos nigripes]|uniref:CFEM domain-containing protein n=1 Tax=Tetrapyrgos nigripes TaxID=182062 RepID=A0A8H5CAG6_9AGAR|nr:hypothetical protein D9758_015387 [Tetrapyrgos nigripes]